MFGRWLRSVTASAVILAILLFIVVNFYVFSSIVNLDSFFYIFLILSLLTDGLFVFIHLPRRAIRTKKQTLDPTKLTIVISSYNGEDVIAETVRQAHLHVPLDQIIVASDASTDRTAEVARETGAQVIVHPKNLHKVRSIDAAMKHVKTPYVLILDDDTLIGGATIPTSLLDEGYTAVAFNVMPVKQKTLLNELQQFEYRNSMQIGKNLRASAGAIGNISGALGLYRTADLLKQIPLHSGQFAGEDEQRTILAHMYGTGKGITYSNSLVKTQAPASYSELWRQRAYSWSMSVPELFSLYWAILLSHKFHYLLKAEKAYQMYIYLTDPLRMLFLWTLFLRPSHFLVSFGFYFALNLLIWLKMGRKDPFRVVLLSPIYTLWLMLARFVGHFYWLKVKALYLIKRTHKPVTGRFLLAEYGLIFSVLVLSWGYSVNHLTKDLSIFNKIQGERLDNTGEQFTYATGSTDLSANFAPAPSTASYVRVMMEQGDTPRAIAYKSVTAYLSLEPDTIMTDDQRRAAEAQIASKLPDITVVRPGQGIQVEKTVIKAAIAAATKGAN
jgi:cellulose synthase/poly-beta-1,6-N-acetylglucosamine synthase-like glycosyltransferase